MALRGVHKNVAHPCAIFATPICAGTTALVGDRLGRDCIGPASGAGRGAPITHPKASKSAAPRNGSSTVRPPAVGGPPARAMRASRCHRMKPFRFGVNLGHAGSRAEWVESARKVEALGYQWSARSNDARKNKQNRGFSDPKDGKRSSNAA